PLSIRRELDGLAAGKDCQLAALDLSTSPAWGRFGPKPRFVRAFSRAIRTPSHGAHLYGGGGGIRTPDALSDITVFETVAFNHSATPPRGLDGATGLGFIQAARPGENGPG